MIFVKTFVITMLLGVTSAACCQDLSPEAQTSTSLMNLFSLYVGSQLGQKCAFLSEAESAHLRGNIAVIEQVLVTYVGQAQLTSLTASASRVAAHEKCDDNDKKQVGIAVTDAESWATKIRSSHAKQQSATSAATDTKK